MQRRSGMVDRIDLKTRCASHWRTRPPSNMRASSRTSSRLSKTSAGCCRRRPGLEIEQQQAYDRGSRPTPATPVAGRRRHTVPRRHPRPTSTKQWNSQRHCVRSASMSFPRHPSRCRRTPAAAGCRMEAVMVQQSGVGRRCRTGRARRPPRAASVAPAHEYRPKLFWHSAPDRRC